MSVSSTLKTYAMPLDKVPHLEELPKLLEEASFYHSSVKSVIWGIEDDLQTLEDELRRDNNYKSLGANEEERKLAFRLILARDSGYQLKLQEQRHMLAERDRVAAREQRLIYELRIGLRDAK